METNLILDINFDFQVSFTILNFNKNSGVSKVELKK